MKRVLSTRFLVLTKWQNVFLILAKIAPASDYHIEDVHLAGGVSAIINELLKKPGAFDGDRMSVTAQNFVKMWRAVKF